MQKFKKGDKVFQVRSWDDLGTYAIRVLEIKSWGKKQGTAVDTTGDYTKHFICTDKEPEVYHAHYFSADTPIAEVEAKALELAAKNIERRLRHLDDCISRYGSDPSYLRMAQRDIERLKAAKPSIIYR